ncbi:malate:quinone oxidoreductase, partial [Acinetobacter junii]|uniref:malate:quinone oxidoreductase n=1 Tax=Acinetobacter junii TaxID=40215 RepID=UPI001D1853E1
GLPEAQQYAGFPVGGEFLVTDNPAITAQHTAKVYGRADLGAPEFRKHLNSCLPVHWFWQTFPVSHLSFQQELHRLLLHVKSAH